jgi:hypothetical protein
MNIGMAPGHDRAWDAGERPAAIGLAGISIGRRHGCSEARSPGAPRVTSRGDG